MNAKAFGLAGGLLWGFMMFITTVLSVYTGYGELLLQAFSQLYPGYSVSLLGSLVGFVYGFLDIGISLFVIALIYNKLEDKV